jgi:hypothetical protein
MDYDTAATVKRGSQVRVLTNILRLDRSILVPKDTTGEVLQIKRVEGRYEFHVRWNVYPRKVEEIVPYRNAELITVR